MDNNLFVQIDSINKKLKNPIVIPQLLDDASSSSSSSSIGSSITKTTSTSYNVPSSSYSSSYLPSSLSISTKEDYPFHLSFVSADVNTDTSSLFGSTFIEYSILIVRNSDGQSKVCKKRFNALLHYYQQLLNNEIITNHDGITFPERSTFAPADPNTPFIKKRMIDLQVFFQKLFNQNPQLYFLPATIEFFEIESIVLNTSSTREKIQQQSQDVNPIKSSIHSSSSIFGSITTFNSSFINSHEIKKKYEL